MLNLFISYSHEDENFVAQLRLTLKQGGYNVWMDNRSLLPGDEWAKEIESSIQASDVLLICCSHASSKSEWVRREIEMALAHGLKIIPLLVEKVPLLDKVSHLHWIDFTAMRYYEEEYQKLVRALEAYHAHHQRTTQVETARIFLSYQHGTETDEQLAVQIENALLDHGFAVFLDDQVIQMGTRGAERVLAAIHESDFYLVLLSPDSVTSEIVTLEITRAYEQAVKQGLRILPVRVGLRGEFPYQLRPMLDSLSWAMWQSDTDTPDLLDAILRAIDGGAELPIVSLGQKAEILRDDSAHAIPSPRPFADPEPQMKRYEQPTGTVNPESRFYIERACDSVMREHLGDTQHGATVVVKAPRQMGKSSLMMQGIHHAREAGKRIAYLDFQMLDNALLEDETRFYMGFCQWIVSQLKLKNQVEDIKDFWLDMMAKPMLCTEYLSDQILPALEGDHLVLAMDEVDRVFTCDFSAGFFGMLRSWHNNRSFGGVWQQVDLVMIISTEPYLLIDNPHQSPFNVGELISLDDFSTEQVAELNRRHDSPLTDSEIGHLYAMIGGHPYLTREALYQVSLKRHTLDDMLAQALVNKGPFADHMMHYMFLLNDQPELETAMLAIINGESVFKDLINRLQSAGLVSLTDNGAVPRNRLYADYFEKHL